MKTTLTVSISLLLLAITSFAQNNSVKVKHKNYPSLSVNYHKGSVLATNDFVKGDNLTGNPVESYQSVALKFGFQNPGYSDWQKIYRGPYYGLGIYIADFDNGIYNPKLLVRYEMKKLRVRGLIERVQDKQSYRLTENGVQMLWIKLSSNSYFCDPLITSTYVKKLPLDKSQPSKIEEAYRLLNSGLELVIKELYIKKAA